MCQVLCVFFLFFIFVFLARCISTESVEKESIRFSPSYPRERGNPQKRSYFRYWRCRFMHYIFIYTQRSVVHLTANKYVYGVLPTTLIVIFATIVYTQAAVTLVCAITFFFFFFVYFFVTIFFVFAIHFLRVLNSTLKLSGFLKRFFFSLTCFIVVLLNLKVILNVAREMKLLRQRFVIKN